MRSISALVTGSSSSEVDVERARKDILGGATLAVHFNSAGDSPMPRPVLERVTRHMEMEASLGGYEAEAMCDKELESVYESAARLINAESNEIALQVRHPSDIVVGLYLVLVPTTDVRRTIGYEFRGALSSRACDCKCSVHCFVMGLDSFIVLIGALYIRLLGKHTHTVVLYDSPTQHRTSPST